MITLRIRTRHLRSDHLELLVRELNGNLLDLAVGSDELLHDLDAAGGRRRDRVSQLRRLQLNDLSLTSWLRGLSGRHLRSNN